MKILSQNILTALALSTGFNNSIIMKISLNYEKFYHGGLELYVISRYVDIMLNAVI